MSAFFPIAGQYPGSATNDSANAGNIGELISASLASGSAVSLTTATAKTVTSISLTPGDWDVHGVVVSFPAGSTVVTLAAASISTTNNALTALGSEGVNYIAGGTPTSTLYSLPTGTVRISLSATTTVYLVAQLNFSVSTATAYGAISARRVR